MNRFWNWAKNEESGERILRLEGVIAENSWFDDEITPRIFRDELNSGDGDITVWINSYGGDVFAAAQIYNMLKDYPSGVTIRIDGIAASAASVIAMAGDIVEISPVGAIMIHNPSAAIYGNSAEMKAAIRMLDEIKETIINAYELKTKLSRDKISKMMDAETWLSARAALDMNFVDGILFTDNQQNFEVADVVFSRMTVTNSLLDKIKAKNKPAAGIDAAQICRHKSKFNLLGRRDKQMVDVQELKDERLSLWNEAKEFLDNHPRLTAEDVKVMDDYERRLDDLDRKIDAYKRVEKREAELSKPVGKPILTYPQSTSQKTGRASDEYRQAALTALRTNFSQVSNYLQEGIGAQGGYLVPDEWDSRLIDVLEEENVLRVLGTKITTSGEHKINVTANKPAALWVAEGGSLTFGDATFGQKTLDAHKLHVGVKITNELLYDNAFNLETYIIEQFGKALANAEEDAFLNGDGNGKPTGILTTLAADTDTTITTTGASISADDILNLVYGLKRPYRKNAVFLMKDSTLAVIRKLKDANQAYMWQPSLQAGEPDTLLGYKIYSSPYFPDAKSGNVALAFGDFSYYNIGDRGTRSFRELREIFAGNDMTAFLMMERVDGVLTLNEAIRILKVK